MSIVKPIRVQKKQQITELGGEWHKPVTLRSAKTSEDLDQAWRTVRSYFGMEIFMDFEIGTPGQQVHILLDSGSDWFWVTNDKCLLCGGVSRFNSRASSSFSLVEAEGVELEYGSGGTMGDHIKETVCLSTARACTGNFCTPVCATDMNIASIFSQDEGLQSLASDGLMGLAPVKIQDERPDLFLDLAKEQGAIAERVFSLNFAGDHEVSYVTFGGHDANQFAVEDLTWHSNLGEYFWAVQIDEVKFGGDTMFENHSSSTPVRAIVDSGSSYLMLPETVFNDFVGKLQELTTCNVSRYNEVSCAIDDFWWGTVAVEDLPELIFMIEGKEYRVPRESLYTQSDSFQGWTICEITMISGWDEWLLGLTFLENYYTVYDMEQSRIGFAMSKTSTMASGQNEAAINLLEGGLADTEHHDTFDFTASLGVGGAAVVLTAAYFARKCWSQKKDDDFKRADQM